MTFEPHHQSPRNKLAWIAGAVLFVTMAGHTALETARDSLFLSLAPVQRLPWTYGAIAAAVLLAAELNGRLHSRFDHRRLFAITLLGGAAGSLIFYQLFRSQVAWAPYAFYIWVAVVATLAMAQFWLHVSEAFTVLEAKHVYTQISTGGLLGAIAGGALSRVIASRLGSESLLVFGSMAFVAAALLPALAGGRQLDAPPHVTQFLPPSGTSGRANVRDLRTEHYLQRLLALTLLSTIAATLIDYMFKVEVARSVPASELGAFFGTFSMLQNGLALFAQLVIAPRLLRSGGVGRSLMLLPTLLAASAAFASVVPGLIGALVLRGADGTLRHSLHRNSVEVLFMPLSTHARARWKMVVDALGQRGGQALAAGIILICIATQAKPLHMSMFVLAIALAWLALGSTMERHYVALFRAKIKAGAVETRAEVPALDMRSLESLVAALSSENDDEVLATIDLLVDYERTHLIPSLLLYHPSREVVIRTLDAFANAGRHDFAGTARRLLERDDPEIREAAMLALATQMDPGELRRELNDAQATAERAALLVASIARGLDSEGQYALEVESSCAPEADPQVRLAFARAFRMQGGKSVVAHLPVLLQNAGPELELESVRAMLASPDTSYIPSLIAVLRRRGARNTAREALVAIGEPAQQALAAALDDKSLPLPLRAHLPRSISRFGSEAATDILLDRISTVGDGWVRFKIIRGLGQLRAHVRRDRAARVLRFAHETLLNALRFTAFRVATEADMQKDPRFRTPSGELLLAVLHDKEAHAIDRAVRIVGLLHSADMIHNIRQALASNDTRRRADSIELLVHRVPVDIARALTALLDRGPGATRVSRAAEALGTTIETTTYEKRMERMLSERSEAVRSIAAYHIAEVGLHGLSSSLTPASQDASALSREVFSRARDTLASLLPVRAETSS